MLKNSEMEKGEMLISVYGYVLSQELVLQALEISVEKLEKLVELNYISCFNVGNRKHSSLRYETLDVIELIKTNSWR